MAVDGWGVGQCGEVVRAASAQQQVRVPGCDVDMAGKDALAVDGFHHIQLRSAIQPRGERAGEAFRHVLGDKDARGRGR